MPYNPTGAANGLFAPPHIAGNPQSVAAAGAWNANRQVQLHPAMPPDPLGPIDPRTGLPRKGVPTEPTVPPAPPRQWPTGFAPPYIPGNQQSADALAAWNATNRPPPVTAPAPATPQAALSATPPGTGGPFPLPGKLGELPDALRSTFQPLTDRFNANNTTGFSPQAFAEAMRPLTSRFPQMPGGGSFTFTEPPLAPQGAAQAQAPSARDRIAQALMRKRGP